MKPTSLVIAEDHTILREGLRAILDHVPELQVVREATDGLEAVAAVRETAPDLLLLDLSMPRMNGMQVLKEVKRSHPETKVLILTVHKTEEYLYAALEHGADGYVLKDSTSEELLLAVQNILAGHRYLCPRISTQVIEGYVGGGKANGSTKSPYDELSEREREVLKLIAEGYRNREIGEYLCISPKTVEKHRSNLMRKLNIRNVQALTAYAIERGLVSS